MSNCCFVRAMSQKEDDFKVFFQKGVVAVGWSKVDFSKCDAQEVVRRVTEIYYPNTVEPRFAGRKKSEVFQFKTMKTGTRILVPYGSFVRLAIAEADELYDPDLAETLDLSNQRKVRYCRCEDGSLLTIPRDKLTEGLQRRLRMRGSTICNLAEFSKEVDALFSGDLPEDRFVASAGKQERAFRAALLERLRGGRTHLKAGGYGLELLVKELLEIDDYEAVIQPKRRRGNFPEFADADILAKKDNLLSHEEAWIQVKHHSGKTGTWGVEQLTRLKEWLKAESFGKYQLFLVTTGEDSVELSDACARENIRLVCGDELVSWIFDALPMLKPKTRQRLGITHVPTFVD